MVLVTDSHIVFNETFESFFNYEDGDLKVRVIHLNHLIAAKDASGRLQDIKKLRGEQS
jgi:UDP-galactopyranose mutase